jgi:predicted AAA+ superfamily ATPase
MTLEAASLVARARSLLIFHPLLTCSPTGELVRLLQALSAWQSEPAISPEASDRGGGLRPAGHVGEAYGALFRALVHREPVGRAGVLTAGIVKGLLFQEHPLSVWAETQAESGTALPSALRAAAALDLRTLQALAVAGHQLPAVVAKIMGLPAPLPWPGDGETGAPTLGSPGDGALVRRSRSREYDATGTLGKEAIEGDLLRQFERAQDWGDLVDDLVEHFTRYGGGMFAQHRAFRWMGPNEGLVPVPQPDTVRPSDLIGYTAERELLRRNTEQFLAGFAANNVLLYGDRGTGKSSSVKALLNEGPTAPDVAPGAVDWRKLRLIELPKGQLADFPAIISMIRARPQRFILFVDDLSFEEGETQYKEMKAMLEGGLEARPSNVVVYATSNRRHLIREQFSDRTSPASDDVHARDTAQEKLSFADRFGMTITFPTPDQAAYLSIVEGLAQQRGLAVEPAVLRGRAIEWAAWHNARSGRTAKQFVDYLTGELGMKREE